MRDRLSVHSRTGILLGILSIGLILASCRFLSGWNSGKQEEISDPSGPAGGRQVFVRTDRDVYRMGDDITITITNNLSTAIRYTDSCSLRLCYYLEEGWFCEMKECDGSMKVMEARSSKEMYDGVHNLVETRSRYEFEYQLVWEDTLYTVTSNEFTVIPKNAFRGLLD